MKQYLQLLITIFRYGRLHSSGHNVNLLRKNNLAGLHAFIPPQTQLTASEKPISFLHYWRGQLAFIKNSFSHKGAHLANSTVCYIRIPKSASTSASIMMLESIYPDLHKKTLSDEQINFLADVNLHSVTDRTHAQMYFTIVRNPFARLVSVYHDFIESASHPFIYSDYLFGIIAPKLSFDEFVDRVAAIPDHLKDQHMKLQHYFIEPYRAKELDVQCFKLEEPEPLNQFLQSHALQLPHKNKSAQAYRYENYYSERSLNQAFTLYKKDVEQFNYQQEYESLSMVVKSKATSQKTVQK